MVCLIVVSASRTGPALKSAVLHYGYLALLGRTDAFVFFKDVKSVGEYHLFQC